MKSMFAILLVMITAQAHATQAYDCAQTERLGYSQQLEWCGKESSKNPILD